MKKSLAGAGLALSMLTASMLPGATMAARSTMVERAQLNQPPLTSVSPADTDAQELLQLLNVQIDPSDPIWQDPQFIALVAKYKEVKAKTSTVISDAGDAALSLIDLVQQAGTVDNEQFQQQLGLSQDDINKLPDMRQQLQTSIQQLQASPKDFLPQLFPLLLNGSQQQQPTDQQPDETQPQGLIAYGYADPSDPVQAGRVVWLRDGTTSTLGNPWTTTWTQTDGPDVQWLPTTSQTDRAFIVPSLDGVQQNYLTFELSVTDTKGNTSTAEVYVDLDRTAAAPVKELYQSVFGSAPSDDDLQYWTKKYTDGMTIDQIKEHFELFKQEQTAQPDPNQTSS